MILPDIPTLCRYLETLELRPGTDFTTITLRIDHLRELTKDRLSTYTTSEVDRR